MARITAEFSTKTDRSTRTTITRYTIETEELFVVEVRKWKTYKFPEKVSNGNIEKIMKRDPKRRLFERRPGESVSQKSSCLSFAYDNCFL